MASTSTQPQPLPKVPDSLPSVRPSQQPSDPNLTFKRTYLSLLPPFQLIDLLIAIDSDRSNTKLAIFPPNLEDAIKHLQAARQAYPAMWHHYYYPPPSTAAAPKQPQTSAPRPTPRKTTPQQASPTLATTIKQESPTTQPSKPFSPSAIIDAASSVAGPSQPRPQTKYPPLTVPRHPMPPDSRMPEDMPSYEEMIVEAITEMNESDGSVPKLLFAWMAARYPLQSNFRPSASQALQRAYRRGRLLKSSSGKYRLNPVWEGTTTTRRTSRRPQHTQLNFIPPPPHPHFWPRAGGSANTLLPKKSETCEEKPSVAEDAKSSSVTLQSDEAPDLGSEPQIKSRTELQASLRQLAQHLKQLVASRQDP